MLFAVQEHLLMFTSLDFNSKRASLRRRREGSLEFCMGSFARLVESGFSDLPIRP